MTTTIFPRETGPPALPEMELGQTSLVAGNKTSANAQPGLQKPGAQHRILSREEWVQFCHGIGVLKGDESTKVIRPTSWFWPPKGLPNGLYLDILWEKSKFTYWFHILASIRWTLMILQLSLNAVLTALGSTSTKDGVVITTIAGVNTLFAGILALLHNSGLPDRYRSNRNEFAKVEEYLKEIVDTRLVLAEDSIVEVMAACFDRFAAARLSVQNNVPQSYVPATSTSPSRVVISKPIVTDKH
ncbi:hypothetical protein BKA67DRAFT_529975 [Truncatella angustata]|uniref:SMODS and SLOG-associating 2TM effector domain-containing protein n=1 Tax=Truncatella angustata TaxID=152316 RepID=A0A9P8UWV3_9PEZI|nr:uncharacterized protein BKA67DRAFT_529975 [Truncatella angustata]KAH6659845.1 hypothetical protein BKA67DRAFT_529975 [Truncatella angustata]